MNNFIKTTVLLVSLTLLFIWLGGAIAGERGMTVAFVMACVMNFVSYFFSDKIVLSMYRAQPISENESPEIYKIIRELCAEAKLPFPKIYLIPSAAPNAFATGRDPHHAVVAVTKGILEILNYEELKGVLAHELGHVAHRDILISSIAATLAGAISMLSNMARWTLMFGGGRQSDDDRRSVNPLVLLLTVILVPVAAMLIQLAISRSREYGADESGAHWCGNPLYLASALKKLEAGSKQIPMRGAEPVTAHLFIVNPLTGGGFASLFSTHPPIEQRIARLEKMARNQGL